MIDKPQLFSLSINIITSIKDLGGIKMSAKMVIFMITAYLAAYAGVISIGGFILSPIFKYPKGIKIATIFLGVAIILIIICILLAKNI